MEEENARRRRRGRRRRSNERSCRKTVKRKRKRNTKSRRRKREELEEEEKEEKEEQRGRAGDFGKINRCAGRKLLALKRHACRKKCNVLFRRRDSSRGGGDTRELRGHGNRNDLEICLATVVTRSAKRKRRAESEKRKYGLYIYIINAPFR